MMRLTKALLLTLPLAASAAALADWRCDCTTVLASCDAQVAVKGNWVEITTDQQACARVDYFIDGLPFVALVVDGSDRQDWISQTDQPNVMVQSCQVCADKLTQQPARGAMEAPPDPTVAAADAPLAPLIQFAPQYPDSAKARGLEGYVVVEFKLTPFGTVEQPRVVESKPSRIFDQAALAAVRRWRYPQAIEGEPERIVQERVEFRVSDFIFSQQSRSGGQMTTASRPPSAGPRNECVRQEVAYNFGEVVEVGLINACLDPVVVFSCAVGTGGDLGRWRCAADDPRAIVLVRAGDRRAGLRPSGDASLAGPYAENHFLMRPPNTEYWWIACNESDDQCHQAGRDWSAQLNGRPATVNPAQVARVRVARSY